MESVCPACQIMLDFLECYKINNGVKSEWELSEYCVTYCRKRDWPFQAWYRISFWYLPALSRTSFSPDSVYLLASTQSHLVLSRGAPRFDLSMWRLHLFKDRFRHHLNRWHWCFLLCQSTEFSVDFLPSSSFDSSSCSLSSLPFTFGCPLPIFP